jgi:hypothetical protein
MRPEEFGTEGGFALFLRRLFLRIFLKIEQT